jgi:hypothetical protein
MDLKDPWRAPCVYDPIQLQSKNERPVAEPVRAVAHSRGRMARARDTEADLEDAGAALVRMRIQIS